MVPGFGFASGRSVNGRKGERHECEQMAHLLLPRLNPCVAPRAGIDQSAGGASIEWILIVAHSKSGRCIKSDNGRQRFLKETGLCSRLARGASWEENVRSNFAGARQCLERAFDLLQGNDRLSVQSREALGLLIEAMVAEECSRRSAAKILPFPQHRTVSGNRP
jgi:hypothetical protein